MAQLLDNVVLDSICNLIWTNGFQQNNFMERVELVVPFSWNWFDMRFFGVEDSLEFLLVLDEELIETLESIELGH